MSLKTENAFIVTKMLSTLNLIANHKRFPFDFIDELGWEYLQ